jgi:hypothetical protein
MDFAITYHLVGEIAVVQVSGWIEIASAPQLRDTLIRVYLDTFEPFGPVLALEKLLRAVQLGRVVSVLGASQCRGQAPELIVS